MRNVLRPYQLDGIEAVRQALREGHRAIMLQAPTGAGKTSIAADIVRSCYDKGKRAYFICDRIELIDQASARFDAEDIPHGVIQADHEKTDRTHRIQVASIQTLARRRVLDGDLYIIDEAHSLHKAHIELMKKHPNVPWVGLSASPWAKGLGKHFTKLVIVSTTQKLIDEGFLVPIQVYGPSKPDLSEVKTVRGDYEEAGLAEATNKPKLVGDIVNTWLKLASGRQTLCFAVNIAHSLAIVEAFKSAGIKAQHLDCYALPFDREKAIKSLKEGRIQVLSSVDLLTKGFDYPGASCAILARPTKSLMVHVQQIGRVLRIAEGKNDALILDHAGNHEMHGFVTDELPTELDDGRPKEKKKAEKKERLPEPCPSCTYLKRTHKCPMCGFAPQKQAHAIEYEEGELELLRGKKKLDSWDKARLYGELRHIGRERGWSEGRLANVFREIVGVWPNKYKSELPREPSEKTLNMVRHLNIRFAKSQMKKAA